MLKQILLLFLLTSLSCSYLVDSGEEALDYNQHYRGPGPVKVTSLNENTIKAQWPSMWGELASSHFKIERKDTNGIYQILDDSAYEKYFIDTGLDPQQQYSYRLSAFGYQISSDFSFFDIIYRQSNVNVREFRLNQIKKLSINEQDTHMACQTRKLLYIWKIDDGSFTENVIANSNYIIHHCFAHNNDLIAVSADSVVNLYNINNGNLVQTIQSEGTVNAAVFSQDDEKILTYNNFNSSENDNWLGLRVYNVADGSLQAQIDNVTNMDAMLFTPDGEKIVIFYRNNVVIYNAQDGSELNTRENTSGYVSDYKTSKNGAILYAMFAGGQVEIWDLVNLEKESSFWVRGGNWGTIRYFDFGFEENQLLVASGNAMLTFDIEANNVIHTLFSNQYTIRGVATSPSARLIAGCEYEGLLSIWSTEMQARWCLQNWQY